MSVQIVLLPVFVLVGLTFALLLVSSRRGALAGGETTPASLTCIISMVIVMWIVRRSTGVL